VTSSSNHLCGELIDELEIECNQAECSTRVYNLSACANVENGIIVTGPGNIMPNQIPTIDGNTNDMVMDQSQGSTPATEITSTVTNTMENLNTEQQSTTVAALAITIVILIVLLVIVSVVLIWTCWTYKIKGATKNQYQQHR
jgi:hypothetical protein